MTGSADPDLDLVVRQLDDTVEKLLALRRKLVAHPRDRRIEAGTKPPAQDEELLDPAALAERTGLTPQHVRRLCRNGFAEGRDGFERLGGRYRATLAAIERMRV